MTNRSFILFLCAWAIVSLLALTASPSTASAQDCPTACSGSSCRSSNPLPVTDERKVIDILEASYGIAATTDNIRIIAAALAGEAYPGIKWLHVFQALITGDQLLHNLDNEEFVANFALLKLPSDTISAFALLAKGGFGIAGTAAILADISAIAVHIVAYTTIQVSDAAVARQLRRYFLVRRGCPTCDLENILRQEGGPGEACRGVTFLDQWMAAAIDCGDGDTTSWIPQTGQTPEGVYTLASLWYAATQGDVKQAYCQDKATLIARFRDVLATTPEPESTFDARFKWVRNVFAGKVTGTVATGAAGINPSTEPTTLRLGDGGGPMFERTIPAGSFSPNNEATTFRFASSSQSGVVGVRSCKISLVGSAGFGMKCLLRDSDLAATMQSFGTVQLQIGSRSFAAPAVTTIKGLEAAQRCDAGPAVTCYTGDPATRGNGACHDGLRACSLADLTYGPCVGEALPVSEVCGDDVDSDCDGQIDEGCCGNGDCEMTDGENCTTCPMDCGPCPTHWIDGEIYCDGGDTEISADDTPADGVGVRAVSQTASPGSTYADTTGDAVPVSPAVPGYYRIILPAQDDTYVVMLTSGELPPGSSVIIPSSGQYSVFIGSGTTSRTRPFLLRDCP